MSTTDNTHDLAMQVIEATSEAASEMPATGGPAQPAADAADLDAKTPETPTDTADVPDVPDVHDAATEMPTTDDSPAATSGSQREVTAPAADAQPVNPTDAADIEEAMRDVVDPELGINIVDLGLVYGVTVDSSNHATLDMTLTSAACPLTDVIEDQTAQALEPITNGYTINWVWMPPWGPDKITDDGREMLRALGYNL